MVPEMSVVNFDVSMSFYCDLLGFEVRNQRADPRFAYLEQGQVHIMLEEVHTTSWLTGELNYPLGRGMNLQMELADIGPIQHRLKEADVSLFRELKEEWYDVGNCLSGQLEFLVQDPDGYLLRFTQYLGEKNK